MMYDGMEHVRAMQDKMKNKQSQLMQGLQGFAQIEKDKEQDQLMQDLRQKYGIPGQAKKLGFFDRILYGDTGKTWEERAAENKKPMLDIVGGGMTYNYQPGFGRLLG